MKDKRSYIVIISILLLATQSATAQSQWGRELGKRIKEKAKRRTEEKVDQKTDQALDSLFVKRRKKKSNSGDGTESSSQKSSSGKLDPTKTYRFEFEATIEVNNYKKKKVQKNTIIQSNGEGALFSTVEGSKVIHDFNNEMAYMIDSERMEARAVSLSFFTKSIGSGNNENNNEDAKVTKTGRIETISGYICHEYIIEHKDGKMEAWFAPDVEFDYSDYMQGFSKMFGKKSPTPPSDKGYVMRMTAFDKKSKKITQMEVIKLEDTETTISLLDYEVTKLL